MMSTAFSQQPQPAHTTASYDEFISESWNNVTSSLCDKTLIAIAASYGQVHGYISAAVCLVGIVSNAANIVVLTRKKLRTAVNALLTALAAADLALMLVYLPVSIVYHVARPLGLNFVAEEPHQLYYVIFYATFSTTCHCVAVWETIAVAIFRLVCISYPNAGKRFFSRRGAFFVTAGIVIACVFVTAPNWFINGIVPTDDPHHQASVARCPLVAGERPPLGMWTVGQSAFASRHAGIQEASHWLMSIVCRVLPAVGLALLTVLLVSIVRAAEKRHRALVQPPQPLQLSQDGLPRKFLPPPPHRGRHEGSRMTAMLLIVVVLFLCVELPHGVMIIAKIASDAFDDVYNHLGDLIDLTVLIALSLNFFLYTAMSNQFRSTFVALFWTSWWTRGVQDTRLSTSPRTEDYSTPVYRRTSMKETEPAVTYFFSAEKQYPTCLAGTEEQKALLAADVANGRTKRSDRA